MEATVSVEEVLAALLHRNAKAFVVPQLLDPIRDRLPTGNLGEVAESQLVLRLDPRLDVGGVHFFEPSVGVGDGDSAVVVNHFDLLGLGILDLGAVEGTEGKNECGEHESVIPAIRKYGSEGQLHGTKPLLKTGVAGNETRVAIHHRYGHGPRLMVIAKAKHRRK